MHLLVRRRRHRSIHRLSSKQKPGPHSFEVKVAFFDRVINLAVARSTKALFAIWQRIKNAPAFFDLKRFWQIRGGNEREQESLCNVTVFSLPLYSSDHSNMTSVMAIGASEWANSPRLVFIRPYSSKTSHSLNRWMMSAGFLIKNGWQDPMIRTAYANSRSCFLICMFNFTPDFLAYETRKVAAIMIDRDKKKKKKRPKKRNWLWRPLFDRRWTLFGHRLRIRIKLST